MDPWFPGRTPRPKFPDTHSGFVGPELIGVGRLSLRENKKQKQKTQNTNLDTRVGMEVIIYLE